MKLVNLTGSHIEWATRFFVGLAVRPPVEYLVGVLDDSKVLVGIAFLSPMDEDNNSIYAFDIKVLEKDASFEIHYLLLERLYRIINLHSINRVMKLSPALDQGSIEFYLKHNFSIMRWLSHYRVRNSSLLNLVDKTVDIKKLCTEHNLRFEDYNYKQSYIDDLCLQGFDILTHGHLGATSTMNDGKDYTHSYSLWQGDRLIAGLGAGILDNVVKFDPLVIHKEFRNSWIFPLIAKHTLQKVTQDGVIYGDLEILEDNRKMMRFAKKVAPISHSRSAMLVRDFREF